MFELQTARLEPNNETNQKKKKNDDDKIWIKLRLK